MLYLPHQLQVQVVKKSEKKKKRKKERKKLSCPRSQTQDLWLTWRTPKPLSYGSFTYITAFINTVNLVKSS